MRRLLFVALFVLVVSLPTAGLASGAPSRPLLAVSVPANQTMADLARNGFVEVLTCRLTCQTTTTIRINPVLLGRKPSPIWVVIGGASAKLAAGKPTRVRIVLNKVGKNGLPRIGSLELNGRIGAMATSNRATTGSANWNVMLKRP